MNKYKYTRVVLLIISQLTLLSCSDFLDTTPNNFLAPETFYKNETECMQALAGVYSSLATDKVYGNTYAAMMSNIDDLSFYARNADQTTSQVYGNDHNPSNGEVYNTWSELYFGVNNANKLIESIQKNGLSGDKINQILGEAIFLRAYYHFLLVQGWHEVPLRKSSTDNIENHQLESTPHNEAIDWIINEMESSIQYLNNKEYSKSPSHVKENTVYGILARVNLWKAGFPYNGGKEAYSKAAFWANKVKESQEHQLNPDLYALWKNMAKDKYDTEYNESIWEAEFLGNRDNGIFSYGRIGNVIGNVQACTSLTGTGYAYGFYSGSLVLWDKFETGDNRRDLSMAPYQITKDDVKKDWGVKNIVERRCGKYRREWEELTPNNKNWTPYNFCILRYADVLLMLAEAENEANDGPTALAEECVNLLRSRANVSDVPKGLDVESFRQFVRDERARELCFEGTRKYDLIRWGVYMNNIKNELGSAVKDSRWATGNYFLGCKVFVERTMEKHQFLPIPTRELAVNKKLVQNVYWR